MHTALWRPTPAAPRWRPRLTVPRWPYGMRGARQRRAGWPWRSALRWRRVDRWRAGEGREPPFVCAAIGCVSAQWLKHRRHWAATSASAGQPTAGGRAVVCARGLTARGSLRSLVNVRQSTQQSADRTTQRRCGPRLAVHSAVRRWVAPASCWVARHVPLPPWWGKALERTLRLAPPSAPRGRGQALAAPVPQ